MTRFGTDAAMFMHCGVLFTVLGTSRAHGAASIGLLGEY